MDAGGSFVQSYTNTMHDVIKTKALSYCTS